MQKWLKILVCAVLSFSFLFVCVGYSAITTNLNIIGKVSLNLPSGLFITQVEKGDAYYAYTNNVDFISYSTTIKSSIRRSDRRNPTTVTYDVVVYNNTDHTYAYRDLYYQTNLSDYKGNNYIGNNLTISIEFPKDENGKDITIVESGQELHFSVTYRLNTNISRNETVNTLVNYRFGINVDSEEAARNAIHDKFLNILNTQSTYETLYTRIDDKYDGSNEWTSNYIGNVGNATADDAVTVNTLFAGQLQMLINGQIKPATVLIKHENLDGNTMTGDDYVAKSNRGQPFYGYGCEMTLYLTTDNLKNEDGSGWAPVYVTVFTCDRDADGNVISEWYQVGDSYEGIAPIVGYNGEANGTGSFITDNWQATTATYSPCENYSYTIYSGEVLKDKDGRTGIVNIVDQSAINVFQQLLEDSKAMIDNTTYAGTGIKDVEAAYEMASKYYTVDANGNPMAYNDTRRILLCPVIIELERALKVAQDRIDEITGGSGG